jgi:hypothetical protein
VIVRIKLSPEDVFEALKDSGRLHPGLVSQQLRLEDNTELSFDPPEKDYQRQQWTHLVLAVKDP